MPGVKNDPIPETVDDALKAWDAGETVFVVEMGGMGPGYEMAIMGLAFEMMRELKKFKLWESDSAVRDESNKLDDVAHRLADEPWAGFSGAQVGAAKSFAACVCRHGYRKALRMPEVKDRLILVCKKDLRA